MLCVRRFLVARPRLRLALRIGMALAVAPFLLFLLLNLLFPYPVGKLALDPSPIVRDCRGEPLRRMLAAGQVWRIVVPLEEISPALVEATIAAEDRRFREHAGVDPWAVLRAAWLNLRHGRIISGASTLTMQLARLVEPRPRTYWGKAVEAFRALQLERRLGKDEILHQYLNRAPYGGNLSGVEAAARAYFGRHAAELDLAQAALVAGLPQAPSRLRPDRHPDRARTRRDYVLDRLEAQGLAPAEAIAGARANPLEVRRRPFEWVARHFTLRFDVLLAAEEDADLRTTLDLRLQETVEERLTTHVRRLRSLDITNGAAVVIEHATGSVRALVGSVAWREPELPLAAAPDEQVDGTRARRSPGSALKPFLYALALDAGAISPSETLFDVPVAYRGYDPENMDRACRGLVSLEEALVSSLNLPAVRTMKQTGVARFLTVLGEAGFTTLTDSPDRYGLGLALGGCEVTLLDLTRAYAVLARGGTRVPLRWRETGPTPPAARPAPVFSREAVWVITRMLQDRSRLGLAEAGDRPAPGSRIAWKTGTSHGHRDAWCVGYDPRYAIGVWVGNPSGRASADLVAVETAAPVLHDLFAAIGAPADPGWPERPAAVIERKVCALSGRPPGRHCPTLATALALACRSPGDPCAIHAADGRAHWPEEVDRWLRVNGMHTDPVATPSGSPAGVRPGPAPHILSPREGERFLLLEAVAEASRLTLRAAAPADAGPLHWFVDSALIAVAPPEEPVVWVLSPGAHRIVCVDAHGRSAAVSITVGR